MKYLQCSLEWYYRTSSFQDMKIEKLRDKKTKVCSLSPISFFFSPSSAISTSFYFLDETRLSSFLQSLLVDGSNFRNMVDSKVAKFHWWCLFAPTISNLIRIFSLTSLLSCYYILVDKRMALIFLSFLWHSHISNWSSAFIYNIYIILKICHVFIIINGFHVEIIRKIYWNYETILHDNM